MQYEEEKGPTAAITLHISCRKLFKMDTFSPSDPIARVFIKENDKWIQIGETEHIENNENPDFATYFEMDYFFEKIQQLKFEVLDEDTVAGKKKYSMIGQATCELAKVMSKSNQTFIEDLRLPKGGDPRGKIIIRAEEMNKIQDEFKFDITAEGLKSQKACLIGKDKPFFYVERQRQISGDNSFIRVYQSPPAIGIKPLWQDMVIKNRILCNGDIQRQIKIKMFNWKDNGYHKSYGETDLTVAQLIAGQTDFPLVSPKNGKACGTLKISNFQQIKKVSFIDFLKSNWKIDMKCAIDFTASNGETFSKSSYHYIDPEMVQLNEYEEAITSVGSVLDYYSETKMYTTVGFGGKPRYLEYSKVSHCFPLNQDGSNQCVGSYGLLSAYRQALPHIGLFGPTYFHEVLEEFYQDVLAKKDSQIYHVIMILTDGMINEIQKTKDVIVKLSKYPVSIIIVGVGSYDFGSMVELDGDDIDVRNSSGEAWARDIVQFVPFREFKSKGIFALSEEVLYEIPDQI